MSHRLPAEPSPFPGQVMLSDASGQSTLWGSLGAGVVVPACADGDLLVFVSGSLQCVPVGTSGQRLEVVAGVPTFVTVPTQQVIQTGNVAIAQNATSQLVTLTPGNTSATYRVGLTLIAPASNIRFPLSLGTKTANNFTIEFDPVPGTGYSVDYIVEVV